MKNQVLTFVNHASFHVTNAQTVLLVDPWVEGPVFNNGWSLLDNSTSNAGLVKELDRLHRDTFIWFSHEHPDHFSVPFIKRLKQDFARKVTLLFQHTKDKRVVTYLRNNGFSVIECAAGVPVCLDNDMAITVYPHADGDSYCLITCAGRHILNLNDCAINSAELCRDVRRRLPARAHIDVLMTQFGYANWVGNPFEPELRRSAADEKLQRIKLQIAAFAPTLTIPFASFVTFSSIENNYLNDHQNSVGQLARWAARSPSTGSIRFMHPGGKFDLDHDTPATTVRRSELAIAHWERLASQHAELLPPEAAVPPAQVRAAVDKYQAAVRSNLLWLPLLLERSGLIKPLRIYLPDLSMTIQVSYVSGYTELPVSGPHDISMTSPSAVFLFKNEYGFNTTHVNGRFRTSGSGGNGGSSGGNIGGGGRSGASGRSDRNDASVNATGDIALARFSRFFMPQNLARQGYGVQHPVATVRYLTANVLGRLQRSLAEVQRRMTADRVK